MRPMPNFYNLLRARKFSTAADTAIEIAPSDSATPNFVIEAGGKLKWSSGSATADTTLYRSAANTLKTDDNFDIASGNTYKIDGSDVLTATSLGSSVLSSSLTSVGSLTSLNAATPSFTGPATFSGRTDVSEIRETIFPSSVTAGVLTCNYNDGCVFYLPNGSNTNFSVSVTNVPEDNNYSITISVIVNQGSTPYYPSSTTLSINSSLTTIKWANSSAPTSGNANKIDIWNFSLIRYNGMWTVLGSESKSYGI